MGSQDSRHPGVGCVPGGEFCFPGVGGQETWAAPEWRGAGCTGWKAASRELGAGRIQGLESCTGWTDLRFPGVGGSGQRSGAGTSHSVFQQGAGAGRAPPCSRGGRKGAGPRLPRPWRSRGWQGARDTAQYPAHGPPPRPAPRRAPSHSPGQAMTRTSRAAGREGPGRPRSDAASPVARRRLINLPLGRRRAESEPRTGPGRSGARGPRVHAPPAGLGRSMPPAAARRL